MEKAPKVVYGVPVVSVVGDNLCAPYPVDLTVKKNCRGLFFRSTYGVSDLDGKLVLQVTGGWCIFRKKRVVRDTTGQILLTLREKVLTWRPQWTAHKGKSDMPNELLFGIQRSSPHQITRSRHKISLPGNVGEVVPSFVVVETRMLRSYKAYRGDNLIAEIEFQLTWRTFCLGARKFKVKVYPGVDHAFIVALVVILNENDFTLC